MSRRAQICMTDQEVDAFLDAQRIVIVATNGADGWPHLMPLWYVVRDAEGGGGARVPQLWSWTYAASQKVRNLERDPRATLEVEDGEQYQELRGVMLKVDVIVHRGVGVVADTGLAIFARYAAFASGTAAAAPEGGELAPQVREMVAQQAPKRVALQFIERERASWDHRKLGGVY